MQQIINAGGRWVMPGLLDIHTHLDLEVEVEPALSEAIRHGSTTVLVGNCSLGTCFGKQIEGEQSPIVDCFARVENMPKSVLKKCVDRVTWDNTGDYVSHLESLPLGANIAAFVPHSMLRIEVMGLDAAISRDPTEAELQAMSELLERALQQGYLGMSTDGLPFHYLANAPNTAKRIPTQHAKFRELKGLLKVVRDHGRTWQTTPIIENKLKGLAYFFLSSGRLFGKPLKTSGLSVMEFVLAPRASNLFLAIARLINSRLLNGNIHFQALGCNFRVWSDGPVSPLFEELPSTCELIARDHDDVAGRRALLDDPAWIERFRKDWFHGRRGWNLGHLKARLGLPELLVIRDLKLMVFDGAPVAEWDGETLQAVYERARLYRDGCTELARSDVERQALDRVPAIQDEADFMRHLFREYDKSARYYVDVSNKNDEPALRYLMHDQALPGFNDSGAHITNMAFYDANLMSLKLAGTRGLPTVARMIERMTSAPAKFFGIDAGELREGARADITIVDPGSLRTFNSNDHRIMAWREAYDHVQMLNRSQGVVTEVIVAGKVAWENDAAKEILGRERLGRFLRAA
ncbi:MAG: amidohydrolase family protein [Haliea sp.]|uniref:amidohydrolase family protein n=1 Tax=Haliea sp. TaxID=1932666 RepID=UPI0032EB387B